MKEAPRVIGLVTAKGPLIYRPAEKKVFSPTKGEEVQLFSGENDVFRKLFENSGAVVNDVDLCQNTGLRVYINKLRKKLEAHSLIRRVAKEGYILDTDR